MRMSVTRRTSPSANVTEVGVVDGMLRAVTVIVRSVCTQTHALSSFRT
jgi:hypothetical protein